MFFCVFYLGLVGCIEFYRIFLCLNFAELSPFSANGLVPLGDARSSTANDVARQPGATAQWRHRQPIGPKGTANERPSRSRFGGQSMGPANRWRRVWTTFWIVFVFFFSFVCFLFLFLFFFGVSFWWVSPIWRFHSSVSATTAFHSKWGRITFRQPLTRFGCCCPIYTKEFLGFSWVLPSFTEFYLVLSSFIEFYLVYLVTLLD